MSEQANIVLATTPSQLEMAVELFVEYAASLPFGLDFQDFDAELAKFPGDYAQPSGCVLLAEVGSRTAGCVALRPLDNDICEMKRMYVRDSFRGLGIGRALAVEVIGRARALDYQRMRLDTVASMRTARALYESLGFVHIEPYRDNPVDGATFLELRLRS